MTLREELIASGHIRPFGGKPIFRTDRAGRVQAARDILEWEGQRDAAGVAENPAADPLVRELLRNALARMAA